MEHFLEGIAQLRHWYINQNENSNKIQIFSSELTNQSLNGTNQNQGSLKIIYGKKLKKFENWWFGDMCY